jgi:hypothetical protein
MGLTYTIHYPGGNQPAWETIHESLARVNVVAQLRMIDGLPAFPDESPPPEWSELRIGTSAGMITLRRQGTNLAFTVWGNADVNLITCLHRVVWSCASAGGGLISDSGPMLTPPEFAESVALSPP